MMIYLDYNASTPIDPAVARAMLPYLSGFYANPSASHALGRACRDVILASKKQIASFINCAADHVVLTSGASESNNAAIKGAAAAMKSRGNHIITTAVEHQSVLNPCRYLQEIGFEVTVLPVDAAGQVRAAQVAAALTPQTVLVSVMHANNEVGTVQPLAAIHAVLRGTGVLLHSDAALAAGKIPVDVQAMGVNLLSLSAHKMYGPKGIGALYVRPETPFVPLVHGIGQQEGRRAGTENVLLAAGMAAACALSLQVQDACAQKQASLRAWFIEGLQSALGACVRVHGHPTETLPNTVSVGFAGVRGADLLARAEDIAASPGGTSCNKGTPSHVLLAMGVDSEWARGTIRFSFGRQTEKHEVQEALARLLGAYEACVDAAAGAA